VYKNVEGTMLKINPRLNIEVLCWCIH